jgi:hypothetical protein
MLSLPGRILYTCKEMFFPAPDLSQTELEKREMANLRKLQKKRNDEVEATIKRLDLTGQEANDRRRWETLIFDSKREINEWDWDAQFGELEDSGDREALYLAVFETVTKDQRLRRERFHREAVERAKNVGSKNLPPIEKREFLAKEIAIAAAHGHIGDQHYEEITKGIEGDSLLVRDKLYKKLVEEFFIPHLIKFRAVVEKRDDSSKVEQTRWFWQSKAQLSTKIDKLLTLCRLERHFADEEKAEWIYELYMAPKFYPEMERVPGAALEYIYWVQGPDCVPVGYKSPDEQIWELRVKIDGDREKKLSEFRLEAKKALERNEAEIVKSVQ